jgi:hypothetical protein
MVTCPVACRLLLLLLNYCLSAIRAPHGIVKVIVPLKGNEVTTALCLLSACVLAAIVARPSDMTRVQAVIGTNLLTQVRH